MNESLVSLIIPTYNRSKLIHERALKSALAQTYANKQIIVVDDGSTEPYDIKLPAWYYKPWESNRGGSAARNFGLTQAKGKYVVFIDDDNMLNEDFLTQTVSFLEEFDHYDAVTTWRYIQTPTYKEEARSKETEFPAIDWGWLINKEVFDKIKYDETIWGDEDADLGIQFRKNSFWYFVMHDFLQTAYVPDAEEEKTSNTYPNERRLTGLRNFLTKNLHMYVEPNERRYILRLAGRNFMKGGYYLQGLGYFWKSFQSVPNFKTFLHLFFASFGWKVYDTYMSFEERRGKL